MMRENPWFSPKPSSSLLPAQATAGPLNRPPALPPDPPDLSLFPLLSPALTSTNTSPTFIIPPPSKRHQTALPQVPGSLKPSSSPLGYLSLPPSTAGSASNTAKLLGSGNLFQNPRSGNTVHSNQKLRKSTANVPHSTTKTFPFPSLPTHIDPPAHPSQPTESPNPVNSTHQSSSPNTQNTVPLSHSPTQEQSVPSPVPETWASRLKKSADKSLRLIAPPFISSTGNPRVKIPDAVFQRGVELHKEYVIGYFFGKVPVLGEVQSVLNHI